MELFTIMAVVSTGLQIYNIMESAELKKEAAEAKKEDTALQRESIELQEKARKVQEQVAEARVRSDLRKAQAKMLTRSAISGVTDSSVERHIGESMVAQVESGISTQRQLSGIQTSLSDVAGERLNVAESLITAPTDLDIMLNIAGATLEGGLMLYAGRDKKRRRKEFEFMDGSLADSISYTDSEYGR